MDGVGNYAGWRWIFILEGILTVLVGVVAPFFMYDFPETAKFLTEEERQYVIHSLRSQTAGHDLAREGVVEEQAKFRMKYVLDALTDWQIYVGLFSTLPLLLSPLRLPIPHPATTLNTNQTSVLGHNLPPLRNLLLSSLNHQRPRVHLLNSPAPHSPHLHHGGCRGRRWSLAFRQI
jgi:MFS family permease